MSAKKNPEETRAKILQAAMEEIHEKGFRAASLEAILTNAGVTKGALYHHFKNKEAVGYAIVDEMLMGWIINAFVEPMKNQADPIAAFQELIRNQVAMVTPETICKGCPLHNLMQEMSPIDETFRQKLMNVYEVWRGSIVNMLKQAQQLEHIPKHINADKMATYILATIEGGIGHAKSSQDIHRLNDAMETLIDVLESMRLPAPTTS